MRKRVLAAQIMHETNTFNVVRTDLTAFRQGYLYLGDEVPQGLGRTDTEFRAFLEASERYNWDLVHPVAASATPSGIVTADAWRYLADQVLREVEGRAIDGVLLALHGAMVTESTDDAEGDLLAQLRDRLGHLVPIIITLDLHANVTDRMAKHANAIIAYRTYPHIDQYERGQQAAELLDRSMRGEISPHCAVRRSAQLYGCNFGQTQGETMAELQRRAVAWEAEKDVLVVSVHAGFPRADICETGPSVAVTTDGPSPRGAEIAESLTTFIWETRHRTRISSISLDEAMALARNASTQGAPVVLADFTDNPGGGGYGDATNLLRSMIEAPVENAAFATILDPEAVRVGKKAGIGQTIRVSLGGNVDPTYGRPIQCAGTVLNLTDGNFVYDGPMWAGVASSMGPTMVLQVQGVDVIVVSNLLQTTDLQFFLSQGIDPRKRAVLAVKSLHHFRAAFEPIAAHVALVEAGGLCSADYKRFPYRNLRRPIWPLDNI